MMVTRSAHPPWLCSILQRSRRIGLVRLPTEWQWHRRRSMSPTGRWRRPPPRSFQFAPRRRRWAWFPNSPLRPARGLQAALRGAGRGGALWHVAGRPVRLEFVRLQPRRRRCAAAAGTRSSSKQPKPAASERPFRRVPQRRRRAAGLHLDAAAHRRDARHRAAADAPAGGASLQPQAHPHRCASSPHGPSPECPPAPSRFIRASRASRG